MEKGINLQAKLHVGTDPAAVSHLRQSLPDLFAQTNPGLTLSVKKVSEPDSDGDATMRVYIEGDQDPAADFAALTRGALNKTIAAYNSGGASNGGAIVGSEQSAAASMGAAAAGQAGVHIKDLKEMEGDEEDTGVTLAPQAQPQASSPAPSAGTAGPAPASPAAAPSQPPAAAPSSAASSSPPPAPSTTQAAGRPWWAFWRRTN
jgi:hypothetical protein